MLGGQVEGVDSGLRVGGGDHVDKARSTSRPLSDGGSDEENVRMVGLRARQDINVEFVALGVGHAAPLETLELAGVCVQLHHLGIPDSDSTQDDATSTDRTDGDGADPAAPAADTSRARAAVEQAVIGAAMELLSGPGGLASFLRRRQLGARLGGPSLPLDIGYAQTVPAGIRNAVILRDKRCRWAGGCNQPAAAAEVHHVTHKANGGKTSTKDCVLLCWFHHHVAIHRWGWTLVLNSDGTTTAWNKDKTKVLHSHGPPARAG